MVSLLARRTTLAVLILVVAASGTLGACNETRRSLGEDCLKGDDCLSAICSSQRCAEAPPLLEAGVVADASSDVIVTDATPAIDAAGDADDGAAASDGADGNDANDDAADGD